MCAHVHGWVCVCAHARLCDAGGLAPACSACVRARAHGCIGAHVVAHLWARVVGMACVCVCACVVCVACVVVCARTLCLNNFLPLFYRNVK